MRKCPSLGEYIEYYVLNPVTNTMERQRILLNRLRKQFPTVRDFRSHVGQMVVQLNAKLAGGWSPYGETQDSRTYTPLNVAIEKYIADKSRDLRDASMVSYTSVCKILVEWCESQKLETMPVYMFNHRLAIRFMDSLLERSKFRNNTYNTYLKKYRACWNWLLEHAYVKENPFDNIKTRIKETKIRSVVPPEYRQIVINHVRNSPEPNYEIVLHLVFYSLIRPSEIERIQIEDIDLAHACIYLSPDKTKTHIERYAPLRDETIELIRPLIENAPKKWYLLGKELVPAKNMCWHGKFKKDWIKIRAALGLPKEMQLYSFKDSGITELLESGVDPLTVMKGADHHDLAITTRYANHRDRNMIEKIRTAKVDIQNVSVSVV